MNARPSPALSERDLVDAAGNINLAAFLRITLHRTNREHAATRRPWCELWAEESARTAALVGVLVECRSARAVVAKLPEWEQRARARELRIVRLREGLGGVPGAFGAEIC